MKRVLRPGSYLPLDVEDPNYCMCRSGLLSTFYCLGLDLVKTKHDPDDQTSGNLLAGY